MAFRELSMLDVKEMLRRWQQGHGRRRIARDSGSDRKTVRRYVDAAGEVGVGRDTELTDDVVSRVVSRVRDREHAEPSDVKRVLVDKKELLKKWLTGEHPLKLSKVHALLRRQNVEVKYATLRRFAMAELDWHRPSTVLLEDPPPGQEAQVDFGRMGRMVDPETGLRRTLWALLVTLSLSRYMFVWPTWRQTTDDVVEGLDAAWWFFGGMPRTLVPDNMKAIVDVADPQSPRLVAAFADYVQARGIFVDPARVRHPRDKARVENQVSYVRESFFEGEDFDGLDDVRRRAQRWCLEVAGRRIHGTTLRVPSEHYEQEERPSMLAAPEAAFDVPLYTTARVHPDHHVQVQRALYSVPTEYLRKDVMVRADRTTVKVYLGAKLIKVHPRQRPGGRSTDVNDYPAHKRGYAMRSIERVIADAQKHGDHVEKYARRLLEQPQPWRYMRQAYALLSLVQKYGAERVDKVCQSALAFEVVDVPRIRRMLQQAALAPPQPASEPRVVQLELLPRFARPAEHFSTRNSKKGGGR